jgi:Tfp pilus assembly protein FimT
MNELIICFLLVKVVQLAVVAVMEALSAPPKFGQWLNGNEKSSAKNIVVYNAVWSYTLE